MKISDEGLEFITREEGIVLQIYKDPVGLPTIGVGHLLTREEKIGGKFARGITRDEALDLLRKDASYAEDVINRAVKVPLNQNQFDALCSMVFNIGTGAFQKSTLLKILNAGDYDGVPKQIVKWVRAGGKILPGLVSRRKNEIMLWQKPI